MSMPEIPEQPHRPQFSEVIIDLLESIALEEIALSHLIHSEAKKIKAFIGGQLDFPTNPTNQEIENFNQHIQKLVDITVMKDWLLYRKLEGVIHLSSQRTRKGQKQGHQPKEDTYDFHHDIYEFDDLESQDHHFPFEFYDGE
ncbi:hypothetical protein [Baia soyae]|uniref:Uncharacterized protein n=1 Tax=Baia soyae TaxID=1544746 RepID=A0A4R2RLV7_9BACL|nr:hypothetical protein [Baia soyae]TCP64123.1 hypothetical protein EDD57_1438 [Baia soyae]